ncbi:MAG TPA: NAD-dependent epimerase/dehydratase family protein, partial [Mycobacteriales bacterium]
MCTARPLPSSRLVSVSIDRAYSWTVAVSPGCLRNLWVRNAQDGAADDCSTDGGEEHVRVLVTGAAGFVGRALVARVAAAGHAPVALLHRAERTFLAGVEVRRA